MDTRQQKNPTVSTDKGSDPVITENYVKKKKAKRRQQKQARRRNKSK